jgi:hypothetical protein
VPKGPGHVHLCKERDASAIVTGNGRAVAEYEPPALAARFLGHGDE